MSEQSRKPKEARVNTVIEQIKQHPVVLALIFLGSVVIAIATFTDAAKKLSEVVSSFTNSPAKARQQLSGMGISYLPDVFVQAALDGDLLVVNLFLDAGMDPNFAKMSISVKEMPLDAAVRNNHIDVVKGLVKADAHIGPSAIEYAARFENAAILKVLLNASPDPEAKNSGFLEAARYGQLQNMRILMENGVSIDQIGNAALLTAASAATPHKNVAFAPEGIPEPKKRETVQFLLDHKLDVNSKNDKGWTPLHLAVKSGSLETIKLLLERGADANARITEAHTNDSEFTPLMVALREFNGVPTDDEAYEIIKVLLDNGADVNTQTAHGETPLIRAAYYRNAKIVQLLVDAGANIGQQDEHGLTALTYAERNYDRKDREEILQVLKKAQSISKTP